VVRRSSAVRISSPARIAASAAGSSLYGSLVKPSALQSSLPTAVIYGEEALGIVKALEYAKPVSG